VQGNNKLGTDSNGRKIALKEYGGMKKQTVREHILSHIAENISVRLDNVKRGVASSADKKAEVLEGMKM